MQAFATNDHEKDNDEEDEREEGKQVGLCRAAARWGAIEERGGTKSGQLLHSVVSFHSFICLFELFPSCLLLLLLLLLLMFFLPHLWFQRRTFFMNYQ